MQGPRRQRAGDGNLPNGRGLVGRDRDGLARGQLLGGAVIGQRDLAVDQFELGLESIGSGAEHKLRAANGAGGQRCFKFDG